jgi:hypothetical protein
MAQKPRRTWSREDDTRVRVLLECEYTDSPGIIANLLEREGFDVLTCEGPRSQSCHLIDDGHCQLVDGADVVVNLLRDPDVRGTVASEVAAVRRPPAVVVEGPRPSPEGSSHLTYVTAPPTRDALLRAINDALDANERGDGHGRCCVHPDGCTSP